MEQSISMERGNLRCTQQGNRVELLMTAENDSAGLYQGWMRGENGQMLTLGTLLPDEGRLLLRRNLPMEQLMRAGCWPIATCGLRLLHRFADCTLPKGWHKEAKPAHLFPQDSVLSAQVKQLSGALLCSSREGFSLALPYNAREPFPLVSLFCFARIRTLGNGQYVTIPFDQDGKPRIN